MNIQAMMKRNEGERRALNRAMAEPFWRPIVSRWLVWAGCTAIIVFALALNQVVMRKINRHMGDGRMILKIERTK